MVFDTQLLYYIHLKCLNIIDFVDLWQLNKILKTFDWSFTNGSFSDLIEWPHTSIAYRKYGLNKCFIHFYSFIIIHNKFILFLSINLFLPGMTQSIKMYSIKKCIHKNKYNHEFTGFNLLEYWGHGGVPPCYLYVSTKVRIYKVLIKINVSYFNKNQFYVFLVPN